jgi:regulator of sigma E protease
MTLLQTLLAFLVVVAVLVVVHEFGHYIVARWCGVKVLRFSVGMGRVVYSRRIGPDQTEWALSILPLGGYVKMLDAREQDMTQVPEADLKREFTSQSVWKRIAIVAAGPLANFLLAIAIFAGLFVYGIPEPTTRLRAVPEQTAAYQAGLRGGELITAVNGEPVETWNELRWKILQRVLKGEPAQLQFERPGPDLPADAQIQSIDVSLEAISTSDLESDFLAKLGFDVARPPAVLGKVSDDGAAKAAGLHEGDRIFKVNGIAVPDGRKFVEIVRASAGKPLVVDGWRNQASFSLTVVPEAHQREGRTIGLIKAEVPMAPEMIIARDGPVSALVKATKKTWETSILTLEMLGKMLIGEVSWKNITGPITIADYAGQTARVGMISYLSFIALISISLGVMNLLPIPILDGGHLLYYSLEIFTGRPVSERFGEIAQRAGLGILMMLMAVAVFNDILRLMS